MTQSGWSLASPALSELPATMVLPGERFIGVARLVVGGVAARARLSFEQVDGLQLAVESVLRLVFASGEHATVAAGTSAGALCVTIEPVPEVTLGVQAPLLRRLVEDVTMAQGTTSSVMLRVCLPGSSGDAGG